MIDEQHKDMGFFFLRIGMALTLIISTIMKFMMPETVAQLLQSLIGFGSPTIIYLMAIGLDVLAILLILGLFTRIIGWLLVIFFVVTIVSGLFAGGLMFSVGPAIWKDLALLGGALALALGGGGLWSIDTTMEH